MAFLPNRFVFSTNNKNFLTKLFQHSDPKIQRTFHNVPAFTSRKVLLQLFYLVWRSLQAKSTLYLFHLSKEWKDGLMLINSNVYVLGCKICVNGKMKASHFSSLSSWRVIFSDKNVHLGISISLPATHWFLLAWATPDILTKLWKKGNQPWIYLNIDIKYFRNSKSQGIWGMLKRYGIRLKHCFVIKYTQDDFICKCIHSQIVTKQLILVCICCKQFWKVNWILSHSIKLTF